MSPGLSDSSGPTGVKKHSVRAQSPGAQGAPGWPGERGTGAVELEGQTLGALEGTPAESEGDGTVRFRQAPNYEMAPAASFQRCCTDLTALPQSSGHRRCPGCQRDSYPCLPMSGHEAECPSPTLSEETMSSPAMANHESLCPRSPHLKNGSTVPTSQVGLRGAGFQLVLSAAATTLPPLSRARVHSAARCLCWTVAK